MRKGVAGVAFSDDFGVGAAVAAAGTVGAAGTEVSGAGATVEADGRGGFGGWVMAASGARGRGMRANGSAGCGGIETIGNLVAQGQRMIGGETVMAEFDTAIATPRPAIEF